MFPNYITSFKLHNELEKLVLVNRPSFQKSISFNLFKFVLPFLLLYLP